MTPCSQQTNIPPVSSFISYTIARRPCAWECLQESTFSDTTAPIPAPAACAARPHCFIAFFACDCCLWFLFAMASLLGFICRPWLLDLLVGNGPVQRTQARQAWQGWQRQQRWQTNGNRGTGAHDERDREDNLCKDMMVHNLKDTLVSLHNFVARPLAACLGITLYWGHSSASSTLTDAGTPWGAPYSGYAGMPRPCVTSGWAGLWWRTTSGSYATLGGRYALWTTSWGWRHSWTQGSNQSRGRAASGGCKTTPDFGHRIIAVRGKWGRWRDVRELNNKEHWSRFNDVFDWVLGGEDCATRPLLSCALLQVLLGFIFKYIF